MLLTLAGLGVGLGAASLFIPDNKNKICKHTELNSLKGDGLQISKNITLSKKVSNTHVLMVKPSQEGKTRGFVMPNVRKLNDCTIIVTDPAYEIYNECKRKDMKSYVFNPVNISNSIGFDPLKNCSNSFEVKQMIEILMTNSMLSVSNENNTQKADWIQMSLPLLKAYSVYNFHTKKYPFDVMISNILTKPLLPVKEKPGISIYEEIMDSNIDEAKVELLSFMQVSQAHQTLACIRNTLTSCLQLFNELNIKKLCRKPTIDFKRLRKEKSILYIQIPERYSRHYSPISSLLIKQLIDRLLDEKNGLRIQFLFDEFCNIGKIVDINQYLSTMAKSNMSIAACIQNLTQFERLYGDIDGKELRELFKTLVIGGSLRDSSEYFSNLMGNKEVRESNNKVIRPLMTASELRMLPSDDLMILCRNKRLVRDKMIKF